MDPIKCFTCSCPVFFRGLPKALYYFFLFSSVSQYNTLLAPIALPFEGHVFSIILHGIEIKSPSGKYVYELRATTPSYIGFFNVFFVCLKRFLCIVRILHMVHSTIVFYCQNLKKKSFGKSSLWCLPNAISFAIYGPAWLPASPIKGTPLSFAPLPLDPLTGGRRGTLGIHPIQIFKHIIFLKKNIYKFLTIYIHPIYTLHTPYQPSIYIQHSHYTNMIEICTPSDKHINNIYLYI